MSLVSTSVSCARVLSTCTRRTFLCHSFVFVRNGISLICTSMSSVYHSYVIRMSLVCHPYITRMYSYVICMSLVCTRMSSICQSYVLICHLYVTCMYSYATRMSSVCCSYVLQCHAYVTRVYSYVIRMSLVRTCDNCMSLACGFTMNPFFVFLKSSWINLLAFQ